MKTKALVIETRYEAGTRQGEDRVTIECFVPHGAVRHLLYSQKAFEIDLPDEPSPVENLKRWLAKHPDAAGELKQVIEAIERMPR